MAAVLATPYAFIYDLTLVAAAATLFAAEYYKVLSAMEVLILTIAILLPIGMFLNVAPPVATLVLGAVLGVILLRLRRVIPVPVDE